MSRENIELARAINADWARGDYGTTGWQHPGLEFVIVDGPSPGSWRGAQGVAKAWGEFLGAWTDFRHVPESFQAFGDDGVLVLVRFSGRGRTSGVELAQAATEAAVVFRVRHGQVTAIHLYFDRTAALAAAGLTD